ncbi:glycine--tRNA ligase subunit beta [Thermodesulfobacteriota bacterium]
MACELLLEVGTEEIPAGYLYQGIGVLKEKAEVLLQENRIPFERSLEVYGTPRRLVMIGRGLGEKQQDREQKITGPPRKAAYDDQGNPTKAALGFAGKHGVSPAELQYLQTPKGEYLFINQIQAGRPTGEVLAEILPKLIADIPWPKSMRWGSGQFPFVRPIHWVLALLEGEVIPFDVAGVSSGNQTMGHRFMSPEKISVNHLKDYFQAMEKSFVIIDPKRREQEVEKLVRQAAETVASEPIKDPELLSEVANMVEFPSAVCGSFDRAFLDLPGSVLITSMKEHQRYFALRDKNGRLMANFVAVNNTLAREDSVVRKGHERVLRARLSDANFFFKEDRKKPLSDRLEDLKNVIYQAELGTSHMKVSRFARLAEYLGQQIAPDKIDDIRQAAELCKCDLVTEMVSEFPSLQGVMGKEYARLDGHSEDVCQAIYEHYLPARAGDLLPESTLGALVGMADRMDTIVGCFAIGREPTGTADPFALRRHSLAILRILEAGQWNISLKEFLVKSISILAEEIHIDDPVLFDRTLAFFRERYRNMALSEGYESELIEAVISTEFDLVERLPLRIDHLKKFMQQSDEFELLVFTFKRITNILKKQKEIFTVDPDLFAEPCESELWRVYLEIRDVLKSAVEKKNYFEALNHLGRLRRPVDDLFDGVEIFTKDSPRMKENRVAILQNLAHLFLRLADFSKFSI